MGSVQPLPAAAAARGQHAQQEPQHSDTATNGEPLLLLVEQLRPWLRVRLKLRLFFMQLNAQASLFLTQLSQLHLFGADCRRAAVSLGALRLVFGSSLYGLGLMLGGSGHFFFGM